MNIFKVLYLTFLIPNLLIYSNNIYCMGKNKKTKPSEEFHLAIIDNNIEKIEEFIKKKIIRVNFKYENRDTPLIYACIYGKKEIAELLIKNNADINHKADGGLTALIAATQGGFQEIVELLIQNHVEIDTVDNFGISALSIALNKGRKNIVDILLKNGASTAYCDLSYAHSLFNLFFFEEEKKDETINKKKEENFKRLLNCVENINIIKNDQTILMKCISYGSKKFDNEKYINILLESGANINSKNKLLESVYFFADKHGKKEIFFDYINKNFNKIIEIIKNKEKLSKNESYLKFKLLLLKIGTIKFKDQFGNNLLHYAIIYGNFEFFKIILSIAPELIAQTNNLGETPLSYVFYNYKCAQNIFRMITKLNTRDN